MNPYICITFSHSGLSVKSLALLGLVEEEEEKVKKKKNSDRNKRYDVEFFKNRLQATAIVHDIDHFWFDDEDILGDICLAWIQARLADEEQASPGGSDEADYEESDRPGRKLHHNINQHSADASEENQSKL